MNEFLFQVANDPSGAPCKCCSAPSEFLAGYVGVEIGSFCAVCIVPYVLQTLRNKGVNLSAVEAGFLKVSAALDAPQGSLLLQ